MTRVSQDELNRVVQGVIDRQLVHDRLDRKPVQSKLELQDFWGQSNFPCRVIPDKVITQIKIEVWERQIYILANEPNTDI